MIHIRTKPEVAALVTLAAALTGCAEGDRLADDGPGGIPTDLTEPAAVIASHALALEQMDFEAYDALLAPEFRFYFRDDEAADFYWVTGESWGYEAESDMLRNLMDPVFGGEERPVQRVTAQLRVIEERIDAGSVILTVETGLVVEVAPGDGWVSAPWLEFTLAPDTDGFHRIRSIRERRPRTRAVPQPIGSSWGRLKARYRTPAPEIPTDLQDPQQVLWSHSRAMVEKNIRAYAALLAPDFEFIVRLGDAADIPWLDGDAWGIEDELQIMTNMTDPDYLGGQDPVWTMEFNYSVIDEQTVGPGMVKLTLDADVLVLVSADNGWLANTRLEYLLVQNPSGYYHIREIRERGLGLRSEEESFAHVKALYR